MRVILSDLLRLLSALLHLLGRGWDWLINQLTGASNVTVIDRDGDPWPM